MKLDLTTDCCDLFLRPGSETNGVPLLTIHVHLDSGGRPPSRIDKLVVSVSSHETMAFPSGRYEQNELFNWKQEVVEASGMSIQPHTRYTWQVLFRVSHETAEYHRSMYGRRYQKATVKLTAPGFLRPRTWDHTRNLFFVHHPLSDDAFTYSRSETSIAEGLGVVLTKASTAHLNVGGYLRVWLEIPAQSPEVERMPFLTVAGSDISTGHWIARLPNDSQTRSSSRSVLDRGLTITHAFELNITYGPIRESSKAKYSTSDAAPVPERDRDAIDMPNEHTSTEHCVCGQSLKVLLAIEGELTAAAQQDRNQVASFVLDEARNKFESGTRTPKTPT
ncbi:unnamed protein product [Tilletia controversa]|uniref:Arrestin-like N-terminal domain-containing protein n=2 Tax=Tilletia TaxID=13289 RepID=A0ABN7IGF0_9BASI|nr:unnamed protein product [Tilletia caries]CAD6921545.1 unnamed protein product [Tilletia controversa]CAD6896369.1 unnamed protein product [Tilletia caries]CAD6929364.1 unnamed protein product [Tilletia controversa]CAD6935012.1 unnamed protein product [Tilletia controversa]